MDKRWKNFGVFIFIVLVIAIVFIFFGQKNQEVVVNDDAVLSKIDTVFEKNNYSKEIFFSEPAEDLDLLKLEKLKSDFIEISIENNDVNGVALRDYYVLSSDLKVFEKVIFNNIQKYALDENHYCENLDEIIDIDLNLDTLNSKYAGLMQVKLEYLQDTNVGVFDASRFILTPKVYSEFSDFVFFTCVALNVDPEAEE